MTHGNELERTGRGRHRRPKNKSGFQQDGSPRKSVCHPRNIHSRRRKLTSECCPLTTHVGHVCRLNMHKILKKIKSMFLYILSFPLLKILNVSRYFLCACVGQVFICVCSCKCVHVELRILLGAVSQVPSTLYFCFSEIRFLCVVALTILELSVDKASRTHMCVPDTQGSQKKASDLFRLEFQITMRSHVGAEN